MLPKSILEGGVNIGTRTFSFIGWLTIIVFFLIPKSLNTEDNYY